MIIFNQVIRRITKNKIKLLVILIMPLVFIIMFALQSRTSLSIGIVDQDNSALSKKLTENLKGMYKVRVLTLNVKEVYDKAVSHQTDYSIIIRQGFEEKLLSGKDPEVEEFYMLEKEKLFYARSFMDSYINNMKLMAHGAGFDREKFKVALEEYDKNKLSSINEDRSDKEASQSRLAMGFLVQFMIYTSSIIAGIILEDKSSGVFYRVFYAPVSPLKYLIENLAAFILIGAAQVAIILTLVRYGFGFGLGNQSFNMYLLFIVFSLVCVSMGILLVSLFKKPIYAYVLVIFLATPLVMLGGCYWSTEIMPDIMVKIGQFLPTFWVMRGVDELLYNNQGFTGIYMEILILLLFAAIFFAGGLFKKIDVSK